MKAAKLQYNVPMQGLNSSDTLPGLLLASTSPRRRQLMALAGWAFEVMSVDVDESVLEDDTPFSYVIRLAMSKARYCAGVVMADPVRRQPCIIVAADTAVVDGDQILGKPVDEADAAQMLTRLCGKVHQVFTGIAVGYISNHYDHIQPEILSSALCITDVPMRAYSQEEMQAYIASGDPLDKAGAYAIQHPDFRPVENLAGCYANVMGLPVCLLEQMVKKFGLQPRTDIPQACQEHLGYRCSMDGLMNFIES